MILLEKDWKTHVTAVADWDTPNRSFVDLAYKFKQMGIKNHAFHLSLLNPSLQGVDPFSPNLTLEQMVDIAVEAKANFWYAARELFRAPAQSGSEPVRLIANRANISLFWSFFNHIFYILIQPRQTGKSFNTDVLMRALLNMICTNTNINLLTKDDNLRRANIQRLKDIAEELPLYLQQKRYDDANNGEEITVNALGNHYNTHVPQMSEKRAYNMGRGLTTAIMHIDEAPFQPNIAISLPAALAAMGAAVDAAKRSESPYGTILTTTAGKKDDKDGRYVYKIVSDAAVWTERFYDAKDSDELELMVRRNSTGGVFRINGTFNHRQLGKTDRWLREKLEESLQTGDDANRDYFNIWTSGSQTSPLPIHVTETIARSIQEVLYTEISNPDLYITRWYITEEEFNTLITKRQLVLSIDTSEAGGGDDIGLTYIDVETLAVVAAGNYNETNLITFAKWLCSLFVKFENLTAIIERRSTGAMILDYLLLMLPEMGIDPFKVLFNRVVQDADEFPDRFREILQPMNRRDRDIYVRYKKLFGYATSGSGSMSRSELYVTTLQLAAKRAADKVHDKVLAGQILGLVTKNGRIDHGDGEHDDMVIAFLLGHWLLTQGKNLAFYGIDIRTIGVANKPDVKEDENTRLRKVEQELIRNRMEELYKELSEEQDDYICIRLEQELRNLDKRIVIEEGEIYSVDEVINKAQELRRAKRRNYEINNSAFSYGQSALSYGSHSGFSDSPGGFDRHPGFPRRMY